MRSLLLIVRREVLERVQTNSFRWFTAGLFVLVMGAILAMDQGEEVFGGTDFDLGVAQDAPPALTEAIDGYAELQDVDVNVVTYADETEAGRQLQDGDIDAFVAGDTLTYAEDEDADLTAIVSNAIYSSNLVQSLDELGVTAEERDELLNRQPVQVLTQDADETDDDERQFIGFMAALALYLTIAIYGNWILTGIVEEKATRVVEVLLGLVRPHELLAGKTLGILIVAVFQLLVAVTGGVLGLLTTGGELPAVALDVALAGVPLYILGLVMYSLLYAAVGSTVSRQADAQAASTPIGMLLLPPYMYAAIFVPNNPDGPASTFLSLFPVTSPLVMPSRVASGSPEAWELALCFALLAPAIALVAFIGGRIYAGAVLSGRKLSLSTLLSVILRPGAAS